MLSFMLQKEFFSFTRIVLIPRTPSLEKVSVDRYRFCFLASSGWFTHSPRKSENSPTVRYLRMISSDTSVMGSKICERISSLSGPSDPLSLWCLVYPENFGTVRRLTVSSKKKKLTRPFIERYCFRVILKRLNGLLESLSRSNFLDTPNVKAFKPKYIERSEVTSERCQKTESSIKFSSSQRNLPHRYLTKIRRFPCENTVQRRKIPVSRFILFTMWKESIGPRKEVKTSDGLETKLKFR